MKNQIKNLVFTAVCIALGLIFPSLFHLLGAGSGTVFLPMHIPVLLCGFICGWRYGGICGFLVPLLTTMLTGLPPLFPVSAAMAFELCAYGLLSGLLYEKWNVYVSLVGAMLGGRVVNGIANVILLGMAGKTYGFSIFLGGAFVTALPGIVIQLIILPLLVMLLTKAKIVTKSEA